MPWKQWAYMERVTSPDFQNFLQNQTVPQFTNAAQRDSLWTPVPPPRGAVCITQDTMTIWVWNGGTTGWSKLWGMPWGMVAPFAPVSAQLSLPAAAGDIPGLTFTLPYVGNRNLQLAAWLNMNVIGGDRYQFQMTDGANAIISQSTYIESANASNQTRVLNFPPWASPTPGSITLKIRGWRVSGTGGIVLADAPTGRVGAWLTDLGPTGPPTATLLPAPEPPPPQVQPLPEGTTP